MSKKLPQEAGKPAKREKFRFVKRHKILSAVLFVVIGCAVAFGVLAAVHYFGGSSDTVTYNYVRTTTLARTSLSDSITATGTIESANVSTVSSSLNDYTVSSVLVQVGDEVEAGDVIVTLDTEKLEEKIAEAEDQLSETESKASESYSDAKSAYTAAVSARSSYAATLSGLKTTYLSAQTTYNAAVAAVSSYQSAYDAAAASLQKAQTVQSAYQTFESLLETVTDIYGTSYQVQAGTATAAQLTSAAYSINAAIAAYGQSGSFSYSSVSTSLTMSSGSVLYDVVTETGSVTGSVISGWVQNETTAANLAQGVLQTQMSICGYAAAQSAYTSAKTAYEAGEKTYDQYDETVSSAKSQMESAYDQLESAQSSDTLDELYEELDECTLTAETSGTVTALNATVGSSLQGTAATIQDTEDLVISISIDEYDIESVEFGLPCVITTDTSDDEISGTLTQISPIATGDGSFSAEVSVDGGSNGLIIGTNASVEIVISTTDDVFVVPYDTVGTNDAGESFVYVQTGGEGTEATFEQLVVETGASNDYYIEIMSDDLEEGMVIRSSADLTEGIEETTEEETTGFSIWSLFGGGGSTSGDMPSGGSTSGDMPSGGSSGDMPSGGDFGGSSSGGSAPSGGNGG